VGNDLRSLCRRRNTQVVPGIRVTYPMQLLTLNRLRPEQKYSEAKISPYLWPKGKISVRDDWRRMADNEFQDFYREFPAGIIMEVDATRAGRVSPLWAAARVQQALGGQDE